MLRYLRYSVGDVRASAEHCIHLAAHKALVWLGIHENISVSYLEEYCACCNWRWSGFVVIHSKSFEDGVDVPTLIDLELQPCFESYNTAVLISLVF